MMMMIKMMIDDDDDDGDEDLISCRWEEYCAVSWRRDSTLHFRKSVSLPNHEEQINW